MPTKGDWRLCKDKFGSWQIIGADGGGVANVSGEANARLICSAVNACSEINPDNPQAVAESIKDMYEALKHVTEDYTDRKLITQTTLNEMAKALAKAEGRN